MSLANDVAEAEYSFRSAALLRPTSLEAHVNVAALQAGRGDFGAAEQGYLAIPTPTCWVKWGGGSGIHFIYFLFFNMVHPGLPFPANLISPQTILSR